MTRDELNRLVGILDAHMRDDTPPAEAQVAWTLLRTELRHRRAQSEQTLPRVSAAAQHLVRIRDEADAGLASMAAVVTPPDDEKKGGGP